MRNPDSTTTALILVRGIGVTFWRDLHGHVLARSWKNSPRAHLRTGLLAAMVIVGGVAAPTAVALLQDAESPPPESATAQVVAQGVVAIGDGDYRWVVSDAVVAAQGSLEEVRSGQGFVIVNGGVLLVEDTGNGEQIRLAAGEAALVRPDARQSWTSLGADDATLRTIELVSADASPGSRTVAFESAPFPGTGARNDLDLLQDVMGPGGTLVIPAGALPTLVAVDGGVANIATEAGDVLSLGIGESVSLSGALTITAGEQGATISVAATGPAVVSTAQAAATPAAEAVIEIEGGRTVATPAASPVADATPAPTAAPDDDGDGLSNDLEDAAGTDPALADTDEDGLTDGQEVDEYETNPLVADTDGDGVLDGDEVAQGTDPNDATGGAALPVAETEGDNAVVITEEPAPAEEAAPVEEAAPESAGVPGDSDGDGLEDAIEFELGTDPFDIDTDDDGLTDGDEYYVFATGTRNPDSDGDGVLDGDEATAGTDPNNPAG